MNKDGIIKKAEELIDKIKVIDPYYDVELDDIGKWIKKTDEVLDACIDFCADVISEFKE